MKKKCYMFIFKLQLFSIGTIHLLIRVDSSYKVNIDVEEFTLCKKNWNTTPLTTENHKMVT
jgi:hypothetical protein